MKVNIVHLPKHWWIDINLNIAANVVSIIADPIPTATSIGMKVVWEKVIRFESTDGRILHGEPILPTSDFDLGKLKSGDFPEASLLAGDDLFDETGATRARDEVVKVQSILCPIQPDRVPILRCVGLNYAKHSWSSQQKSRRRLSDLLTHFSPSSKANTATFSIHLL